MSQLSKLANAATANLIRAREIKKLQQQMIVAENDGSTGVTARGQSLKIHETDKLIKRLEKIILREVPKP